MNLDISEGYRNKYPFAEKTTPGSPLWVVVEK